MKISIVTPVLNAKSSLLRTLESVAGQETKCEHIIVDGGSSDGSHEIALTFAEKTSSRERPIKVFSEPDNGIYDAMNRGISHSAGDAIGMLNADDAFTTNKTLSLVEAALSEPDIDACYGDLHYIDPKTERTCRIWRSSPKKPTSFLYGWMPPHPTFFLLRSHYEKLGGYRTDLGTSADYEIMLRMLHLHKIKAAYIPADLVTMTAGGASAKSIRHRIRANRWDRMAWSANDIRPLFITRLLKPTRKLYQYIIPHSYRNAQSS